MEDKKVGFIQGVVYAAAMMKKHGFDAYDLIKESGISSSDIKKYGEETDVEVLEEVLKWRLIHRSHFDQNVMLNIKKYA